MMPMKLQKNQLFMIKFNKVCNYVTPVCLLLHPMWILQNIIIAVEGIEVEFKFG